MQHRVENPNQMLGNLRDSHFDFRRRELGKSGGGWLVPSRLLRVPSRNPE